MKSDNKNYVFLFVFWTAFVFGTVVIAIDPNNQTQSNSKSYSSESFANKSLTQIDLKQLAAHDIVLLVDKSASMNTPDCPGVLGSDLTAVTSYLSIGRTLASSRWRWCCSQIKQMATQAENVLSNGFTVILFDFGYKVFTHVNVNGLEQIFAENRPGGGTNMALPLDAVFQDYSKRRDKTRGNIKPLLIGIITDGCPNSQQAVEQVIIAATHMMRYPSEISVVFFLIGQHDKQGERFISKLENGLTGQGATYNIVKSATFTEMQKTGLAHSLVSKLQ